MKTYILIRIVGEGAHYYPDVKDKYPELAELHKHRFVIMVQFEETGSREIEFVRFRRKLIERMWDSYGKRFWFFGPRSCETIATEVAQKTRELLEENREITVTVWEDDEGCAGSVKFGKDEKIQNQTRQKRTEGSEGSYIS